MNKLSVVPGGIFLFIMLFVPVLVICGVFNPVWASETLKVGIFQNKPIVYFEDGPKGLYVDILNAVAEKENWKIEYILCDLETCMDLLRRDEIDLMTSLGQNAEKLDAFYFSRETIWTFWGTVYANDVNINGIFNLRDKKIAVRPKNNTTIALKTLLAKFKISAAYVEFDNYESAFKALEDKELDAIAVNNTYAFSRQKSHTVIHKTPIVFNPFPVYFAVSKTGDNQKILETIDDHVKALKADSSSIYYVFEKKWFGLPEKSYWTAKRMGIISGIFLAVMVFFMAVWRYRSVVRVNEKLTHSIAEREQVEKRLKESEAKYRSMIEAMDDPAYICSKNFRVEYMNAAMLRRIDGDATGEPCYKAIHNLDKKCPWCIHEIVMKGESIKTEVISPRDNKIYNISNSPILHIYGAVSKLTIFRDITETKNMEKRLEQAQRMESIGNLAGGIAHDFNNLLFPIMGISEMLLDDLAPDSQEYENVQVILEAGKRGSGLVKQILAFSRQAEHKMIPVRVQYVLNEALKLSRSTIPINIEITQEVQNDCGLVMADPIQLHQIAMNLITNAYHAVGQTYGRIAVKLKTVEICSDDGESSTLETGHYVMLSVSDDGCGIEPAVMDKIFDPYFTTKEKTKGTGLGLSVVYGIVKQHKGDIKVYSEIGNGSMFKVFLPLMKESVDSSFVDQRQTIKMGTERILIVDDEASIVRVEKQMLERLGYAVTDRISSIEALKTFRANPTDFDLVITDMTMPNMTGDQLAKELIAIRSDIPVIICTGFSESINREKAESAGIKGLLMKPVVKSEMAEMVRKSLNEEEINL